MTTDAPARARPTPYDDRFYEACSAGALRSARAVVPIVLELTGARSVVDFGCGRGAWLRAFVEAGVDDVLGIDGAHVDRSKTLVDPARMVAADLARPFDAGRRFDLATCLEVGEHLPTRASLDLVRSLAAAAPLVLFSAAIPGQGGTDHRNEQWPEFWRRLFARSGLARLDAVRPRIHADPAVDWWYRQNLYLFAADPSRVDVGAAAGPVDLEWISPAILDGYQSFGGLCREAARAAFRGARNRVARLQWERRR